MPTMTDGPVRPAVQQLLRRPFKLNLPGPATSPGATAPDPPPGHPPASIATAPPAAATAPPPPAPRAQNQEAGAAGASPSATATATATATNPPTTDTPRQATQLSREQILHATAHCLDQAGYDGTTIRKIAKRLGCAVGSIYRYFSDKRELLDAVVQSRFTPVLDALANGASLQEATDLYIATAVSRPEQYRLMFWLCAVGRAPDQPTTLPEVIHDIIDRWAEHLDGHHHARRHWGTTHGELMLGLHDSPAA